MWSWQITDHPSLRTIFVFHGLLQWTGFNKRWSSVLSWSMSSFSVWDSFPVSVSPFGRPAAGLESIDSNGTWSEREHRLKWPFLHTDKQALSLSQQQHTLAKSGNKDLSSLSLCWIVGDRGDRHPQSGDRKCLRYCVIGGDCNVLCSVLENLHFYSEWFFNANPYPSVSWFPFGFLNLSLFFWQFY